MNRSLLVFFLSSLINAQNDTSSNDTTPAATTPAATTTQADSGNTTATTTAAVVSTAAASTAAASTAAATTAATVVTTSPATDAATTAATVVTTAASSATNAASTAGSSATNSATSASLPSKLKVTATVALCSDNQVSESAYKLVMCSTMFGVTISSFNDTWTNPTGATCTLSGFSATAGTCSRRRGRQLGAGFDHTGDFVFEVADPTTNTAVYQTLNTQATAASASATGFKTLVTASVASVPAVNGFGTVQSSTTTQSVDDGTGSSTGGDSGAATFFVGQVFTIMAAYLYIAM